MKTIEELGQLVLSTWDAYWRKHGLSSGSDLDACIEAAKAIVTVLAEDGVSWAPGDD
jgi:hypothetical protein